MIAIIKAVCGRVGIDCSDCHRVSGGDIKVAYCIDAHNNSYFLKVNSSLQYPSMFNREAEGLKALRKQSLIKVPEVLAIGEFEDKQYLLLQWLKKAAPSGNFWETFGEGVARLHRLTNPCFGWSSSNYIGSLPQLNDLLESWGAFYSTQRILPLVNTLYNQSALQERDLKAAEKLCLRLDEIFPEESPSLLHGDLWSGNFMAINDDKMPGNTIPAIYDAAVYFGHREMDMAMSLLFGGFDRRFYEVYHSHYPLEPGWKERIPVAQLYPLLVHSVLFGGSYIDRSRSILNAWGG